MITSVILQGVIYKDIIYIDLSNPNERIDIVAKEVSSLQNYIQPIGWRYGSERGVYAVSFLPKNKHHKEKRTSFKQSTVELLRQVHIEGYTHKVKDNTGDMSYIVSLDKLLEETGEKGVLRPVRYKFKARKAMALRSWYARNTVILDGRLFKYEQEDFHNDKVMLCTNNVNIAEVTIEGYTEHELQHAFKRLEPLKQLEASYKETPKVEIQVKGTRFGYEEMP